MANPFNLLVPGTRIELVQSQGPRDFKSLASTSSATQAFFFIILTGYTLLLKQFISTFEFKH